MTDFWIDEDDAERLVAKAEEGSDPLGLGRFIDLDGLRFDVAIKQNVDKVSKACRRMLMGLETVPEAEHMPMDELTARMLAHLGVHPLNAAMMAKAAVGLGIHDTDGDHAAMLLPEARAHSIHDGELSCVTGKETLITMPRVPLTAVACLQGSPLNRIVSHPVLDMIELIIEEEVEYDPPAARRMTLRVTGVETALSRERLAELAPPPKKGRR